MASKLIGGIAAILICICTGSSAMAADASVPNTFTNGQTADADQVNANFAELESAVNSKQDKLTGSGCPAGQVVQSIAVDGATTCIPDATGAGGDITGVATGTGLAGGGLFGDVTVSIAAGGVGTAQIADSAVDATRIATDAVGSPEIAADSVGSSEIQAGAVKSQHIDNASVQQRVAESCAGTGAMESVNTDGTVVCTAVGLDTLARTLVVSPVGDGSDATLNGDGLLDALALVSKAVPVASATNPWFVKVEPGIYDVGTTIVLMTPFVDIEGSGLHTTRITGEQSGSPGVVVLSDNTELRFLTVENRSTDTVMVTRGITVSGTTSLMTHVRVLSQGPRGQGLVILSGREATVKESVLVGTIASLGVVGTGNIVSTQLDGPVLTTGVSRCVGAYNASFAVLNATCT